MPWLLPSFHRPARCPQGFSWVLQHVFQSLDRAQGEKGISAHSANFGQQIVKDNDLPPCFTKWTTRFSSYWPGQDRIEQFFMTLSPS